METERGRNSTFLAGGGARREATVDRRMHAVSPPDMEEIKPEAVTSWVTAPKGSGCSGGSVYCRAGGIKNHDREIKKKFLLQIDALAFIVRVFGQVFSFAGLG